MFWIVIELFVFLLSILILGLIILEDPSDIKRYALLVSVFLLGISIARRSIENESKKKDKEFVNKLSQFIVEGGELRKRSIEDPLPIQEHNDWVENIRNFLVQSDKSYLVARLDDASGMTFFVDGSEKSQFNKSINGRVRRLNEFISETKI